MCCSLYGHGALLVFPLLVQMCCMQVNALSGTISSLATQSRQYAAQVQVAYLEPVNCTLDFDADVVGFTLDAFTKASTTSFLNFEMVSASKYTFQVFSEVNANVSIYLPARTVQNVQGLFNTQMTAFFSFQFYKYPPSATLRVDGYQGATTQRVSNTVFLVFNSTVVFDSTDFFTSSLVSISPHLAINSFQRVDTMTFSFRVNIPKDNSVSSVECVDPSGANETYTVFLCDACPRTQLCSAITTYPPAFIQHLEFPFLVSIQPIFDLGMSGRNLSMLYDTLSAAVDLSGPTYAKGPFFITVTWSEPMRDLAIALPTLLSGPAVDQALLQQNRTIMSPTSLRLLVAPAGTGVLTFIINGTQDTRDLAGNSNDFRLVPGSRTHSELVVIYSAGPPLAGTINFQYARQAAISDYPPVPAALLNQSVQPSLTVSWNGFITATEYDVWIQWGRNASTPVVARLTNTSCTFSGFEALLGTEYQVNVQARSHFGDIVNVTKVFLHPQVNVIADGNYSIVSLPNMMSQRQTNLSLRVLIPRAGFLERNPLRVLSFRSIDRTSGDRDPCLSTSQKSRCTFLNFHIEVPGAQFVVFRQPLRLQFDFGTEGWPDRYFRPKLMYWETFREQWRLASSTCPSQQVYDRWNDQYNIYEVSICHLTLFAVFEVFSQPPPTTVPPPPSRPSSYTSPAFFVILGGAVIVLVLMGCLCYWAFIRPGLTVKNTRDFNSIGIRSVADRLPSRRVEQARKVMPLAVRDAPHMQKEEESRMLPELPAPSGTRHPANNMASANSAGEPDAESELVLPHQIG